MSLQFIFGNSGSGKSDYLYEHILERAGKCPDQNFLILVPEQFTMQTQRELVNRQKNHAIMNVDVLSFARLAYRVFDELGKQDLVILEETGKNLLLRKVAEQERQNLHVLGGNLNKMGYIGEIKSLISELTQYNVTPEELEKFLQSGAVGEALRRKMQDILTMYRGFRTSIEGNYITAEEVLSLLCDVAEESALLRGSVIVFDEFTGFTPIQNELLRVLLPLAERVLVSVSMDIREDFYHSRGVHELFAMSKKTVGTLQRTASELAVSIEDPIVLEPGEKKRYRGAPELFFMEQNLFRPTHRKWQGRVEGISIASVKDPREELSFVARRIARLVREQGYRYRDIAVVTGDVPGYANYVPEIFEKYGIPYFIDQTRNILFHPFIEFIRAALEVVEYDFSYQSIFRFLRSGLVAPILLGKDGDLLRDEDIDCMENYVLARGIRGRRRWGEPWKFVMPRGGQWGDAAGEQAQMIRLNQVRERIVSLFAPLCEVFGGIEHTVAEQTYVLYQLIRALKVEAQLQEKELAFQEIGNQAKAKEYAQIYKVVMDLFDKMASLLGEERIPIREYGDILDAGFSAAKVGIIPPGNDRVMIGDIERTRLNHIRILFFVGVNDGIVPKAGNAGGIISQFEREKMAENHLQLAPGAREKVFIQKFYLYLNLTKPSDALYLTFSKVNADGKALRPSYLIGTLLHMFPQLVIAEPLEATPAHDVLTPESGMEFFLEGLGAICQAGEKQRADKASGARGEQDVHGGLRLWEALTKWYLSKEAYAGEVNRLLDAAFTRQGQEPIGRAVARALYGRELTGSITRLERFASCAFAHYLDYGLRLRERELHEFASVDMGNIYHDALEHFAKRVDASEYTWFDLPPEVQRAWIEESMEDAVAGCRSVGVFEEAKNRYLLSRMKDTVQRNIWALTVQIQKGRFVPRAFEVGFSQTDDLDAVSFRLSEEETMRLSGRIDRMDTYETEDKVYVKIIDYKSGNTSFSLLNLYHGLQLQLVVYLNAALELTEVRYPHKTAEPAGIFYYHIDNPMVEGSGNESEEEIRRAVLEELKPNGLVNDDPAVYLAMDVDFSGSSAVIPVARKADGSLKATSKTASTQDFHAMSEHVNRTLTEAGQKILGGDVSVQPYQLDDRTGCDYCPYHTVCGFDTRIPGFSYRRLERSGSAEEILEKMRAAGQT